jgi:hypothetical protein
MTWEMAKAKLFTHCMSLFVSLVPAGPFRRVWRPTAAALRSATRTPATSA